MAREHPNVTLLSKLDITDIAASADLFAEDVIWHYHNPNLPEVSGDYVGPEGIGSFFEIIGGKTGGTFRTTPVSVTPVGDELVVVQAKNTMTFEGRPIALDVLVVWRIRNGRITEVWDIVPATPTASQG